MVEPLRGNHLLLDGVVADVPTADKLWRLIDRLIAVTGLHPVLHLPRIVDVRSPAWLAFQVIAESHISVHGSGYQGHIDVFSCRPFDADASIEAVTDGLGGRWWIAKEAGGRVLDRSFSDVS